MKRNLKSILSVILTVCTLVTFVPNALAAQSNEYVDPADRWITSNNRTNELDVNATTTYETQHCLVCNKSTTVLTYRVPEYTKSGATALNRSVMYSDGTCIGGEGTGNLDGGTPGVNATYTGYHWTKTVCQTCGTINSGDGLYDYGFNKNVYSLNSCDHSFFLDFDNTTYEKYDEDYHLTTLKKGQYCQFCKGTFAKATQGLETHDFGELIDGQIGNNRFYVSEKCEVCDYETNEYVTAKSVIAAYYGVADGDAHTVTVSSLSDKGVRTSIRYGTDANDCTKTSAPNYTEAGYYTVYYEIEYSYSGESMTENGVSYVWLIEDDSDKASTVHEHEYHYLETIKPGCDELGYERFQCNTCGDLVKRNYVPATGHKYENIIIKEATCKQGGQMLTLCSECGDFYQTITAVSDHKYSAIMHNATCRSVGYTDHVCEVCGDNYITNITPIVSHAYERITKSPTCVDVGYTTSTCTMCGLNTVSDYTDATGHDWDEGTVITNSTCSAEGVIKYSCTDCLEIMVKATTANGHTPGAAATCTEPQLCEVCETVLQLPHGHNYGTEITEPTCTAMGYTTYTCTDCNDSYVSDHTDRKEHNYVTAETAPTCTKHGYTTYSCSDCAQVYESDYQSPLGHNVSDWIVDSSASIENTGSKHRECTVCSEVLESIILPILADKDNSDEDGRAQIGDYTIILIDENGKPIFNSELAIDILDNVSIKLTNGRLLDYAKPTTITAFYTETKLPKENLNIYITDSNDNSTKGKTNADGQLTVPYNETNTGDTNGTLGAGTDEEKKTFVVTVRDKDNEVIPDCDVHIGENGEVVIKLPEGVIPATDNQITMVITDQNGKAQPNVSVTVTGDSEFTANGTTDTNGKLLVPIVIATPRPSSGGGGGGSSYSSTAVTVKDKYGKTVSVSKSVTSSKATLTLPTGKSLADNYYTITVKSGSKPKSAYSVILKDRNGNELSGKTDSNGTIILPNAEHKAYIEGYDDGTFRPDNDMTRAEAAAIFARLIAEKKGGAITGKASFSDISMKDWSYSYIGYLEKYNIIDGYDDGTFRPNNAVTRAEFVAMAVRYYGLFSEVKKNNYTVNYTDIKTTHWAYSDIAYAKNVGWISGYADGTFKGDNNITRAEVVTITNHATDRAPDEEYINKNVSTLNKFTDLKNNSHWGYYGIIEAANTHSAVPSEDAETWIK